MYNNKTESIHAAHCSPTNRDHKYSESRSYSESNLQFCTAAVLLNLLVLTSSAESGNLTRPSILEIAAGRLVLVASKPVLMTCSLPATATNRSFWRANAPPSPTGIVEKQISGISQGTLTISQHFTEKVCNY
jgi:hypothetical protein